LSFVLKPERPAVAGKASICITENRYLKIILKPEWDLFQSRRDLIIVEKIVNQQNPERVIL